MSGIVALRVQNPDVRGLGPSDQKTGVLVSALRFQDKCFIASIFLRQKIVNSIETISMFNMAKLCVNMYESCANTKCYE